MTALHPVAHIAASRIVRCERENVVAAELALQFGKIPDPVTDVKGGIVEVVLRERFPELSRDPCGGMSCISPTAPPSERAVG